MTENKPWFCQDCRVLMIWKDNGLYMACPVCKMEVWPDPQVSSKDQGVAEVVKEETGVIIPVSRKGRSSNKGKSKKHLLQKKTTKAMYDELCK